MLEEENTILEGRGNPGRLTSEMRWWKGKLKSAECLFEQHVPEQWTVNDNDRGAL